MLIAVKLKYTWTNTGDYSCYHFGTWQQQPPQPSLSLSLGYTEVMSC